MASEQLDGVLRYLHKLADAQGDQRLTDGQLLERFCTRRDQAAFEALLRRHGLLVWGVCRRVLHQEQDAEDAFQATFLILARKAGSLDGKSSLGSWLYTVAYRLALRARANAARRCPRASPAPDRRGADPLAEITGRELLGILDEELQRLPENLRASLVLCCLEGRTRQEAARQLGWPTSTVKGRLKRGRELLQRRLRRRGLMLPAALAAAALAPDAAAATVPAALFGAAVQAALLSVAGQGAPAILSGRAVTLAEGALRTLVAGRAKVAAGFGLAVAILGLGTAALTYPSLAGRQDPAAQAVPPVKEQAAAMLPARPPTPARDEPADHERTMAVTGRVVGPNGKAVAHADVAVVGRQTWPIAAGGWSEYRALVGQTQADADGRFRLSVPRPCYSGVLLARAKGYGLEAQPLDPVVAGQEATLQLTAEQLLRGRLVDLQGQAASGVKVFVSFLSKPRSAQGIGFAHHPANLVLWPPLATTDAKGRFLIHGVSRSAEVSLKVRDDRFTDEPLNVPTRKREQETRWALSPARTIEGRILCADTGKPVAGARASAKGEDGRTDKEGRFRLHVAPERATTLLVAYPPPGEPYLGVTKSFEWARGTVRHNIEVKLPRGVLVRGKVMEKPSGKPVAGAGVQFIPRQAADRGRPENVITGSDGTVLSGADGSFRIAVLPGPGHLLVTGPTLDYLQKVVGSRVIEEGEPGGFRYHAHGVARLNTAARGKTAEVHVTLRRGVTVKARVVGPNGRTVSGAIMVCPLNHPNIGDRGFFDTVVHGSEFELHGCDPAERYPVYVLHPEKQWGAAATLSASGGRRGPVTVRLAACGKAVARFVDAQGRPIARLDLDPGVFFLLVITPGPSGPNYLFRSARKQRALEADEQDLFTVDRLHYSFPMQQLDAAGRCTLPALISGATYRIAAIEKGRWLVKKEFKAEAGKTLDLKTITLTGGE